MTFAFALYRPILTHPRWFSFLLPFYAMFLAQGLVTAAERLERHRDLALAFLTAGLLLYSVPVLGHYYEDTASRPYRWREAAAEVKRDVRPGDFFLYVGLLSKIAFTHYFPDPFSSSIINPIEAVTGPDRQPTFRRDQVAHLAQGHRRVWVIATLPWTLSMQERLVSVLGTAFRTGGYRDFNGVMVYLFETKSPSLR